jgi:hypothetical protein
MIEYILFEKKSEGDNPVWDKELAVSFCKELCKEQEVAIVDVVEEQEFIIVKTGEPEEGQSFRLLEVTPTITFIFRDDPSLDEFMEVETVKNATQKYECAKTA